ncbi:unnamed protein product [Cunninghamella echinulata]
MTDTSINEVLTPDMELMIANEAEINPLSTSLSIFNHITFSQNFLKFTIQLITSNKMVNKYSLIPKKAIKGSFSREYEQHSDKEYALADNVQNEVKKNDVEI